MDGKNRGAWWKLASGGADLRRPEVIEHEAEMSRRARAAQKHPRYWAHALGIALLMTQFKPVMSALGGDGNFAWAAGMVLTIAVGAFVAGVWHLFGALNSGTDRAPFCDRRLGCCGARGTRLLSVGSRRACSAALVFGALALPPKNHRSDSQGVEPCEA